MKLRAVALVALAAGAAGSFALMLYAGRRQPSALLVLSFTAWVLSPFIALALAHAAARQWTPVRQVALYGATIGVSFVALSVYVLDRLLGPHARAAFVYLVVPAACWMLIGVAFATAARIFRD